jgi:hypothetical protein
VIVEDLSQESEFGQGAAGLICVSCGHEEGAHIVQDSELPGGTMRRTYCQACEAFHDFVPDPRSL